MATDWYKIPNYSEEKGNFHECEIPYKKHLFGAAITTCMEDMDGFLFVDNGEYGSQVNFCPMCGYEAKNKIVQG